MLSTPKPLRDGELRSWILQAAIEKDWKQYFVAPDNVIALSDEGFVDPVKRNYTTLYRHSVAHVRRLAAGNEKWARATLSEDGGLTAYNTRTLASLPGDELSGFGFTSCTDLELRYSREKNGLALHSTRFSLPEAKHGTSAARSWGTSKNGMMIFRVEEALEDLIVLYRRTGVDTVFKPETLREAIIDSKGNARRPWGGEDEVGGRGWQELVRRVGKLRKAKDAGTC